MSDKNRPSNIDLTTLSDEELVAELARRRAQAMRSGKFLDAEIAIERHGHVDSKETFSAWIEDHMSRQDTQPKPCPKCGKRVFVKSKDRERKVRTMLGELTLRRHYHYCERCQHGFYPLDMELGLDDEGEFSPQMSARILDFGVTSTFDEAAQRWSVHHAGSCISENAVRLVVERAGRELERVSAQERHQALSENTNGAIASGAETMLVAQIDGSMLQMRDKGQWNEAKLGLVYRQDHHVAQQ